MNKQPATQLNQARVAAREAGIDLTTTSRQKAIAQRRAEAHRNALATDHGDGAYTKLEAAATGLGDLLTMALILTLTTVLLPVAVLGLAAVEIQRVTDGIALFDDAHAAPMALVVIASYLALLAVRAHLQVRQTGTTEKPRFSLRLWFGNVGYVLGISDRWQPRHTTPLERLERASGWLAAVIVVLGSVGSLRAEIAAQSGAWHVALTGILTNSDMATFLSFAGAMLFTVAVLGGLHWLVSFSYGRYVQLRPDLVSDAEADASAEAVEIEYLQALVVAKRRRDSERAAADAPKAPGRMPYAKPMLTVSQRPTGNGTRAKVTHSAE